MGPTAVAANGQLCKAWTYNIKYMLLGWAVLPPPLSMDGDMYPGLALYLPDKTFEDAGSQCRQLSQGDWLMNYMRPVSLYKSQTKVLNIFIKKIIFLF